MSTKPKPQKPPSLNTSSSSPLPIQRIQQHGFDNRPIILVTQLISFAAIFLASLFLRMGTPYDNAIAQSFPIPLEQLPIDLPSPKGFPILKDQAQEPTISAKAAIVADYDTHEVLWQKAATTPLAPASLTKLLTVIVASKYCNNDTIVTVDLPHALDYDEASIDLKNGEKVRFEDLLYGALVPSGNDAALAIATYCKHPNQDFITLLNQEAAALGLKNSHFTNPTGKDDDNNYTSAADMLTISQAFMKEATLAAIVKTQAKTITDTTGSFHHSFRTTNQLLGRKNPLFLGLKTGTTDNAGQNFIGVAQDAVSKDQKIVLVELSSSDRFGEALALFDWVKMNVAWQYPGPLPNYQDYQFDLP